MNSLNEAFKVGELFHTQKQGGIKLLLRREKSHTFVTRFITYSVNLFWIENQMQQDHFWEKDINQGRQNLTISELSIGIILDEKNIENSEHQQNIFDINLITTKTRRCFEKEIGSLQYLKFKVSNNFWKEIPSACLQYRK